MTSPSRLVVDASAGVKWYVAEPDSDRALALLQSGHELIAPDLLISEIGNIFWKKVQRGELSTDEAALLARLAAAQHWVRIYPASTLLAEAVQLAMRYRRSVYDSLYLALAVAQDCALITADERLVNALRDTPLAPRLRLLSGA